MTESASSSVGISLPEETGPFQGFRKPGNSFGLPKRHSFAARKDDLYESPPEAVYALMKAEHLPKKIWEPACGPGAIVKVLRGAEHEVVATDLREYGCPDAVGNVDFLKTWDARGCDTIVTNPPFKIVNEFIEHALRLVQNVVVLARLQLLTSVRRKDIMTADRLVRVHVFRNRLPMMHRAGWEGKQNTSQQDYGWFVFGEASQFHRDPTIHWLTWEK